VRRLSDLVRVLQVKKRVRGLADGLI
jgi:hypothetical protein